MDQFEAFDIRAWTESALTVWNKQTARAVEVVSKVKQAAAAALVASTAAFTCVTASAGTLTIDSLGAVSSFAQNPVTESDPVPVGYWTELITSMQQWKSVAETDVALLPAPLL